MVIYNSNKDETDQKMSPFKTSLTAAGKILRKKMPQESRLLMVPKRLWMQTVPTQGCEVVLLFSKSAQEATVNWLAECIKTRLPELVFSVKNHASTGAFAFYFSATMEGLLKGAEEMKIKKRLKREYGNTLREITQNDLHLYQGIEDGDSFFTSQERQGIIFYLLSSLRVQPTDQLNNVQFLSGQSIVSQCEKKKLIQQIFPLHDRTFITKLKHSWVQSFFNYQPIDNIHEYFGAKICVYFSWIGFYTASLIIPATVGFLFWGNYYGKDETKEDKAFVILALLNVIWGSVWIEAWKRKSAQLSHKWGTQDMNSCLKDPRPQYVGDLRPSPITGAMEPHYPSHKRNLFKTFVTAPIMIVALLLVVVVMSCILYFQSLLDETISTQNLPSILSYCPKIFMAVVIAIFDEFYYKVAVWLNDQENYRNDETYHNNLIVKVATFRIVNSFFALFYIAFYLQNMEVLKEQMLTLFLIRQLIGNVKESCIPFIQEQLNQAKLSIALFGGITPCENAGRSNGPNFQESFETDLSADAISNLDSEIENNFRNSDQFEESIEPANDFKNDNSGVINKKKEHTNYSENELISDTNNTAFSSTSNGDNSSNICTNNENSTLCETTEKENSTLRHRRLSYVNTHQQHISSKKFEEAINGNVEAEIDKKFDFKSCEDLPKLTHRIVGQAEIEANKAKYDDEIDEYLEILIQFGYIMMFSSAFPLGATCAFFNNLVEIRSDAFKLCCVYQRPFGDRVGSIGVWQDLMELMCILGIIVNCMLIGQSGQVHRMFPEMSTAQTILLIVILEHTMIALKCTISYTIPKLPQNISEEIEKAEFRLKEAFRKFYGRKKDTSNLEEKVDQATTEILTHAPAEKFKNQSTQTVNYVTPQSPAMRRKIQKTIQDLALIQRKGSVEAPYSEHVSRKLRDVNLGRSVSAGERVKHKIPSYSKRRNQSFQENSELTGMGEDLFKFKGEFMKFQGAEDRKVRRVKSAEDEYNFGSNTPTLQNAIISEETSDNGSFTREENIKPITDLAVRNNSVKSTPKKKPSRIIKKAQSFSQVVRKIIVEKRYKKYSRDDSVCIEREPLGELALVPVENLVSMEGGTFSKN